MGDTLADAPRRAPIEVRFVLDEREVERLDRVIAAGAARQVVLDLSSVTSATGLGVWGLARLQERWTAAGRLVRVRSLSPAMYAALELTGVDAVLLVEDFGTPVEPPAPGRAGVRFAVLRTPSGTGAPYLVLEDDPVAAPWGRAGFAVLAPGLSTLPPVPGAAVTVGDAVRLRVADECALFVPVEEVPRVWLGALVEAGACRVLVAASVDPEAVHPYRMVRPSLHDGRSVGGVVLAEVVLP